MVVVSIVVITVICLGILWLGIRSRPWRRSTAVQQPPNKLDFPGLLATVKPKTYRDLVTCEVIASGELKGQDLFFSIYEPLQARAGPNQRLVQTFRIDNAFTTTDMGYWRRFRQDSARMLRKSDEQWRSFAGTAAEIVHRLAMTAINGYDRTSGVILVSLVQSLVLKFAIFFMFDVQPSTLDDATVAVIADKINSLWIASKHHDSAQSIAKDQKTLFAALQRIMPYDDENRRENPLNLILPAYETMWRIVLRCFLEVKFRSEPVGSEYLRSFTAFLADPTLAVLKRAPEASDTSVEHILNEALRLYPPTRRIYRQVDQSSVVAADIELLHRDPRIWGEDALQFKPTRWRSVSEDVSKAFMPFGGPRHFTCPSKGNAGPRMIGILVAALLAEFSEEWHWAPEDPEGDITGSEPLRLERDSY
ncbi:MAG: hypothetical protein M1812_000570 [Candelaria pacifica]|nr:MAG: hypothetical protein M1812_000570 [Candelaria pacifica]